MSFLAGGEGFLRSFAAPANPQLEASCWRKKGGIRGKFENGDRALAPDGQRNVGWPTHRRPTQGKAAIEEGACAVPQICAGIGVT